MNKAMFIMALGAMAFIGWLYLGEMSDVRAEIEIAGAHDFDRKK